MVILSPTQIAQYQSALSDSPAALSVLELIEDCEGDLEDAAISLALQVGQEPDRSDNWLGGLAKRWRPALCQANVRAALEKSELTTALAILTEQTDLGIKLAVPVMLYLRETNIDEFCQPLQEKLTPNADSL